MIFQRRKNQKTQSYGFKKGLNWYFLTLNSKTNLSVEKILKIQKNVIVSRIIHCSKKLQSIWGNDELERNNVQRSTWARIQFEASHYKMDPLFVSNFSRLKVSKFEYTWKSQKHSTEKKNSIHKIIVISESNSQ